jgi:hypothetical protein
MVRKITSANLPDTLVLVGKLSQVPAGTGVLEGGVGMGSEISPVKLITCRPYCLLLKNITTHGWKFSHIRR